MLCVACGGGSPRRPPATHEHFRQIQREEAILADEGARAGGAGVQCTQACASAERACGATDRLCELAESIADADARVRCRKARTECRDISARVEGRCDCESPDPGERASGAEP